MAPKDWQTGVVIVIQGDKRECTNYRGISLLSLHRKTSAFKKDAATCVKQRECVDDAQCGFHPSRSVIDELFIRQKFFEES